MHLHNHSQFSVLQSTMSVADIVAAAAEHNMPAVALTDHANMMGAFHFVNAVNKHNKGVKAKNEEAEDNGDTVTAKEINQLLVVSFLCVKIIQIKREKITVIKLY